MRYQAAASRYETMHYRRCGRSGLQLPALSLGLWHNFGDVDTLDNQRCLLRRAFDLGIIHFDLANNYGPPPGSAERNFGRLMAEDFRPYRDELIISTKAGYYMWPGPHGQGGSRKSLLASLDQSLSRMGLDYVDIFYSHCVDTQTPPQETAEALASAVEQGKALYVGISSYSAPRTREIVGLLRERGVPCLIHQPSYNLFNRWVEQELLDTLEAEGMGCIAFTPLAQGLLTDKYLNGVPDSARINQPGGGSMRPEHLSEDNLARARALNSIAERRGQNLAQMALAWLLRDPRVTSVLIGASRVEQLEDNVAALDNLEFSNEELVEIDHHAVVDAGVNLWAKSSEE
ncbi:L-glyceraldehyde 3-phosphate reductase [Halomonas sp. TRM85114]|uniref:L-glyceraldehyde 3-phosphate reductase n=1 Tax=Halomonas jincaotanensis TaxID=2810616 RepID=UPI001BD41CEE|nr:L-glyceraldehyde 3-phosphate reductase [Halomonas jincaotanensis]MBS9402784.1 L-glyceraldehyde 3-phosphate reductase [Halomonas jincaotanensis]